MFPLPQLPGLHPGASALGLEIALLEVRHLRLPWRIGRDRRDFIGSMCGHQSMAGTGAWQGKPSQDPSSAG